ncbi:MAG: D-Ala-D-Ala carboxypeptidase family metallohydrolase [Cyanobacteria bacterium J06648_10]
MSQLKQQKLIITEKTIFKSFPIQSADLKGWGAPDELVEIPSGAEFVIRGQIAYEGVSGPQDDHLYVELVDTPNDKTREHRWYVYGAHALVEGTEPNNNPTQDEPVTAQVLTAKRNDFGPKIRIPGISNPVGIFQPVYEGSHFLWAELTKGGERIPVSAVVSARIVQLCKYLDSVRAYLGNRPIKITSGYRDPVSNRRVGGARSSRHMSGDAVDFWVEGLDCVTVYKRLKKFHPRGGLAVGNGFVHLDLRPGPPARWTYPGGPRVALW